MCNIRKYGSTFYIGIAMVVFPYIGTMGKLKFHFSLSQIPLIIYIILCANICMYILEDN